jgi:NodT family efflux transporter outer membrane factor (OMF) lipoprotein
VGPDYCRPDAQTNASYVQQSDPRFRGDIGVNVEWWKTFNDPVLERLIDETSRQNLTLRQAGVRVLQSMAARGIAVGELFPQSQTLGGSFSRARANELYASSWSLGFDASWELDFWGKFRRSIEAADAELDGSLAQYDAVMVTLFGEVASTYVTIRTYEERLDVARQNVQLLERSLQIAQEKLDAGSTSRIDVEQATASLRSTQSKIPSFEAARKQAIYSLSTLIGRPPSLLQDLLGPPGRVPSGPAQVAVGVPAELLRRLPSVRIAERAAAAASADIGVAKADLYPSFFLNGSIGLGSNRFSSLWDSSAWTGVIQPGFAWPVLNYGRIRNNVLVSSAEFQAAALDYQETVLEAAAEVESSLAAYAGALDEMSLIGESLASSKRAFGLSMIQYREGEAPFTRTIQTQSALLAESDGYASLRGSVALNLIAIYKALGGGWEISVVSTSSCPPTPVQGCAPRPAGHMPRRRGPCAPGDVVPQRTPGEIPPPPSGGVR